MIINLWNNDHRVFHQFELQGDEAPPHVEHEGVRYHSLIIWPQLYISPPSEEALLALLFRLWNSDKMKWMSEQKAHGSSVLEYNKAPAESAPSLEEYIYGQDWPYIALKDNEVGIYEGLKIRKFWHDHIIQQLEALPVRPARLVEFGCGTGTTLLDLKRRFPDIEMTGLELSESGIKIARDAADYYELAINFVCADATADLKQFKDSQFDIGFCSSVLGIVPDYVAVFANLSRITRSRLWLYESFPELWPATPRGWASLYYFKGQHYNSGVFTQLAEQRLPGNYQLKTAYLLKNSGNPFSERSFAEVSLEAGGL